MTKPEPNHPPSRKILDDIILPRMKELNLTPYQLSKETGITEGKLSLWINDKQDITWGMLHKICKVLKIKSLKV